MCLCSPKYKTRLLVCASSIVGIHKQNKTKNPGRVQNLKYESIFKTLILSTKSWAGTEKVPFGWRDDSSLRALSAFPEPQIQFQHSTWWLTEVCIPSSRRSDGLSSQLPLHTHARRNTQHPHTHKHTYTHATNAHKS